MNRSTLVLVLSLSATVGGAAAGCKDPAKDSVKATVTAPADSVMALPKLAGAVELSFSNEGSKVGFVGSKVTGRHDGGFEKFTGSVALVENDATKSAVFVEITTDSIFTDTPKLTGHLKGGDFFDTAKNPRARFVSTAIAAGADKGTHTVTGNLDLHGVTKQIKFPATITVADGKVDVEAEFAINRKDFAINYKGKADDLVRDDVIIKLSIHAKK